MLDLVDPSSIFERSVQESAISCQSAPQADDFIPPILAASAIAITDQFLDPDGVEIVTHAVHQPAAAAVAASAAAIGTSSSAMQTARNSTILFTASSSPVSRSPVSLSPHPLGLSAAAFSPNLLATDEAPETYSSSAEGQDVRRLSFISFADLVLGEQLAACACSSAPPSLYGFPLDRSRLGSPDWGMMGNRPISAAFSSHFSPAMSPSGMASPSSGDGFPSPPTSSSSRAPSFRGIDSEGEIQTIKSSAATAASPPPPLSILPTSSAFPPCHLPLPPAAAARRPASIAVHSYSGWSATGNPNVHSTTLESRPQSPHAATNPQSPHSPHSPLSMYSAFNGLGLTGLAGMGASSRHSQVVVETMGQALKRTTSGDILTQSRNMPGLM